jgi:ComF family protein
MAEHIRLISDIDLIIPVPLHTKRLRFRGFNQALLLAQQIHEAYRIPLSYDNLLRVRATQPQVELSGEQRIMNVAGAFDLRDPGMLADKLALLVDDVFTTGATMNECAAVLKNAGASQIIGVTLARVV